LISTQVCDRYAFSGVAFSAAKESIDDLDWCKAPDAGLPAPDIVVFLEIPPDKAEARSGFGNERYEVSDMQVRVAANFNELVTPCWPAHESNFPVLLRIRTCTPSTRRLLDSVTAWVPHRSIQWTRPHRRRALTRPHRRRALDSLVESRRCWRKIDAARPIDEVRADVERCVLAAAEVACSSPVKTLWED
jgi:thymidylate kinase